MRTTITLDDDVFRAAKALACSSGETLGTVLSQLARSGLLADSRPIGKNELPVFQVPLDAPLIPSSRARKVDASERLREIRELQAKHPIRQPLTARQLKEAISSGRE